MKISISKNLFNKTYLPLLFCDKRYLLLYGGAGSGKSVFAVQRFVYRLLTQPLCNLLVVRAVAATNRDSTYALFQQVVHNWNMEALFKSSVSDMRLVCKATGNSVIFKGLDDVEKLKSVTFSKGELTEVWVEEASEIEEADFNQLDIRLRGKNISGQIVLTFNPISAMHWLKKRFFDRKEPKALAVKTTYKDNRFLTEDYRHLLEAFQHSDPYYYSVYCLGEWGVLGKTVFHARAVSQRLANLPNPEKIGEFLFETYFDPAKNQVCIDTSTIRFQEREDGYITIYKSREAGAPYVIGGDTSGEGSDFFVGQVVNNLTGEQICTLRHQFDEDLYARQMYCLGKYYNNALIAIEANFSSYPIRELEKLGYGNQYVRESEDSFTHRIKQSFGFKTTGVTRPLVLAELVGIVREHADWIYDRKTLEEMLTFVRSESGRAQAQHGAHDDCILALAIAYYARAQQYTRAQRARWTADMYEDYRKAKPAEKKMLLQKWSAY